MNRPADPGVLYAAFLDHVQMCASCRAGVTPCPYGENLHMALGESETFYANEAEMIEAAKPMLYQEDLGDQDELRDCA